MKKALATALVFATLIPLSSARAVSTVEIPVSYQLEFNKVTVEEAQAVIDRTEGS